MCNLISLKDIIIRALQECVKGTTINDWLTDIIHKCIQVTWVYKSLDSDKQLKAVYTLIAFDERVTFWLQRSWSLPCACAFAALYACTIA